MRSILSILVSGEADHATDFSFLSKELEIIDDVSGNPTLTLDSPLVHVQCRVLADGLL